MLGFLLYKATHGGGDPIRIELKAGGTTTVVGDETFPPAPGPLFRPAVDTLLRWAGVRRWPWTRGVARANVEVESSTAVYAFDLTSSDIRYSIGLTRIRRDGKAEPPGA